MGKSRRTGEDQQELDPNKDHYPTFDQAVRGIRDAVDIPGDVVEYIEINCLKNGEVTYRYWRPYAEEPEGGYLSKV